MIFSDFHKNYLALLNKINLAPIYHIKYELVKDNNTDIAYTKNVEQNITHTKSFTSNKHDRRYGVLQFLL